MNNHILLTQKPFQQKRFLLTSIMINEQIKNRPRYWLGGL